MNNIEGLRDTLFETLNRLKAGTIDVDRAKAVNETAQVIINTVKIEIDHMRIAGGQSGFVASADAPREQVTQTAHGTKTVTLQPTGGTVTRHKLA
jgi:hypothetical protein